MKIKYFASGFFLFARNFSRGIQKSYLEHRAGIIKIRKIKGKKVLTKIKDMMTHLRSGNDMQLELCVVFIPRFWVGLLGS